jgi:hypothetical protein
MADNDNKDRRSGEDRAAFLSKRLVVGRRFGTERWKQKRRGTSVRGRASDHRGHVA